MDENQQYLSQLTSLMQATTQDMEHSITVWYKVVRECVHACTVNIFVRKQLVHKRFTMLTGIDRRHVLSIFVFFVFVRTGAGFSTKQWKRYLRSHRTRSLQVRYALWTTAEWHNLKFYVLPYCHLQTCNSVWLCETAWCGKLFLFYLKCALLPFKNWFSAVTSHIYFPSRIDLSVVP